MSVLTSSEEQHYHRARSLESKRRTLFRAKLYPALNEVRDHSKSCIVYSSFPLHELGRMLMEEEIPFRFIHNESTSSDMDEARKIGLILLGPTIPIRFNISTNLVLSLDVFLSRADHNRLASLAKRTFRILSIPSLNDNEPTVDAESSKE